MTFTKAIATSGDVHVLRGRTSIAIFQHEEDADLFIQAKRDGEPKPIGDGQWSRRGKQSDPVMPCPHTMVTS